MMLTIRDIPDGLVYQAKAATGKGTGSQAFIAGVQLMLRQADQLQDLRDENARLKDLVRAQAQTIERARSAAMHLVEATGQGDLLADSAPSRRRPAAAADESAVISPRADESIDMFMARLSRQGRS